MFKDYLGLPGILVRQQNSTDCFISRLAVSNWSKHGFTSLVVPGHIPLVNITIFVDIATNPGPPKEVGCLSESICQFKVTTQKNLLL